MTVPPGAAGPAGGAPLLTVRGLRISSRLQGVDRVITTGSDFSLAPGETLGIVGESGSGKSLTARALIGLLPAGVHAEGEVEYRGRDILTLPERQLRQIRGSELAMIFQDPFTMLNPLMRCGAQIVELIRDERGRPLKRARARQEAVRRLAEVGITDAAVADAYPFELSGGMRQRVGIAAAIARDPQVLIADEPSTALDVTTQREILARLREVQQTRGMGLILITHDLRVAFALCDRVLVLYAGSVLEVATAEAMEAEPLHPYTLGLLLSDPPVDRRLSRMAAIPGSVPSPDDVAIVVRVRAPVRVAGRDLHGGHAAAGRGRPGPLVGLRPGGRDRAADAGGQERHAGGPARPRAGGRARAGSRPGQRRRRDPRRGEGLRRVRSVGRRVTALKGVSLEIGADEAVGLVGESGSGKIDARPVPGRARDADGRHHRGQRHRHPPDGQAQRRRPAPPAADRADGLPGPVLVAQPGPHRRRDARRSPLRGRRADPGRAQGRR